MKQTKAMRNLILVSTLALAVAGCSRPELILEGMREDIRSPAYDVDDPGAAAAAAARAAEDMAPFQNSARPANIGAARATASWPQRGANAQNRAPHAQFSASPQLVWSSKAGQGNERKYRITAEPVSDGSRVFTMDSHATVSAHTTGGGAVWSADLTRPGERGGSAMGGGLALGDGKLFVTTTNGELVALDPASGQVLWRQKLDAAINGAPTVANGQVYVTTAASVAYAVNTDTGRIAWRLAGIAGHVGVSGVAAPAVSGNTVIFPLANESLIAVETGNGDVKWVARAPGNRPGRGRKVLSAYTGEPVVADGVVYAATAAGEAIAVGLKDGKLRWKAGEGAQGTMAVAGGSVYFVTDEAKLVRLSARDGAKVWSVDLPRYRPSRVTFPLFGGGGNKSIWPAYGPVLAGGRLWIAQGDGILRSYNPADGALVSTTELPAGAASRPILVGGMMLFMSEKGDLLALR